MSSQQVDLTVQERLERLETRLERLEARELSSPRTRSVPPPRKPLIVLDGPTRAEQQPLPPHIEAIVTPAAERPSLTDLLAGRGLAWLGAVATLLGITLFLALAIAHGWIGREARVVLAGIGSATLVAAGIRLRGGRLRPEAAVAMVGAGTAGLFATMVVAGDVYHLISPLLAVAGSIAAGALATALAIRWAGRAIGAIGLVGALLSPALVGASSDAGTVAIVAVASAAAAWVVARQRWGWLALVAPVAAAPQWIEYLRQGHAPLLDLVVLAAFAAIGLAGAVGAQLGEEEPSLNPAAATLLVVNAFVCAVAGRFVLNHDSGATMAEIWLAGFGAVHASLGLWYRRRLGETASHVLIAIGAVLADVAFSLTASGLALTVGWGSIAIGCSWLVSRSKRGTADELMLGLGLGGHVMLLLMRTLVEAPPSTVSGGSEGISAVLTVAVLAASCLGSGRAAGRSRAPWRAMLDSLGLLAILYMTAIALDGTALVLMWAAEAVALSRLHSRGGDPVAGLGACAFLGVAVLHALAVEAPPDSLVVGAPTLGAAAVSLGAIAAALFAVAIELSPDSPRRGPVWAGVALTLLYLASIAIVTPFQQASGADSVGLLDLGVRQEGQVLLSALWSVVGLAALVAGLRVRVSAIRTGGLMLLLGAVAKVFLYDLSTLTSIYRVISFIVLGLLLLAGAYAHHRMRELPESTEIR